MAVRRIQRELDDVSETLARAKAECVKFRSVWDGDEAGGRYHLRTPLGSIEGSYSVDVKTILFLVEKKPKLIPWTLVERGLDAFLNA